MYTILNSLAKEKSVCVCVCVCRKEIKQMKQNSTTAKYRWFILWSVYFKNLVVGKLFWDYKIWKQEGIDGKEYA